VDALPLAAAARTLATMRSSAGEPATLDDVVELLKGIGLNVMGINAAVQRILDILEGEGDDEADA
jgi:hypothetical protein